MHRLLLAMSMSSICLCAGIAGAQNPERGQGALGRGVVAPVKTSEVQATPEMWFYEQQMNRYNNPQEMVRQNAAFEAAQRKQRLAALKWYGFSNSRPMVNPTPFGASYAPTWTNATIRPWSWASMTPQVQVMYNNNR